MEDILETLNHFTLPEMFKNTVNQFGKRNCLSMVNGSPLTYHESFELE
jgi:hypothetical protein